MTFLLFKVTIRYQEQVRFKIQHPFENLFFPFNRIFTVKVIIHGCDIKFMNYETLLSFLLWITTFGHIGLISIIKAIHVIYRYIILCHNPMQFILICEALSHSSQRAELKVHPEGYSWALKDSFPLKCYSYIPIQLGNSGVC